MTTDYIKRIESLNCWEQTIHCEPLKGGFTNRNYLVEHGDEKFFVRLGVDIPEHGVYRFNELAASRAAYKCGISPEVVYAETGAMVLQFINGKTLEPGNLQDISTLKKVIPLLKTCHQQMPLYLPGSSLIFWVFQVIRGYVNTLKENKSRMIQKLSRFLEINHGLEKTVGTIDLFYGHNDLLSGNFIEDNNRLWLVDWDYAGFNSPLFDLANLASNNEFAECLERELLKMYFENEISDDVWKHYFAMKCASLLRESMWSMVSEIYSTLDFDYVEYTSQNLERFENTFANFRNI